MSRTLALVYPDAATRADPSSIVVYSTGFGGPDEDPLSEGGAWVKNPANPWSQMRLIGGNAVGSQGVGGNSGNDYNDSYAINKARVWGSNYVLDAIVYRSASIGSGNHEVELLVRMADDADSVRGVEVLLNKDGLIQCFRWNDSFGSFTPPAGFTPTGNVNVGSVPNGARFAVKVQGNTISVYYSSDGSEPALQCTFDMTEPGDFVWTNGDPGIGQFCRPAIEASNAAHFGFQFVTITKLAA